MAPARSYGLPYHLLYPICSLILISIPAFTSATNTFWVSANTATLQIRFGSRDFCGYNATQSEGVARYNGLGCVYGGYSYDVSAEQVGMWLPGAIVNSLSRGAALCPFVFAMIIAGITFQAYVTRYSFTLNPAPQKDKLYTCVQIHFILTCLVTLFGWITFLVIVCINGSAADDRNLATNGVAVWWGANTWLVLASAICMLPWMYEAIRWRFVENVKT